MGPKIFSTRSSDALLGAARPEHPREDGKARIIAARRTLGLDLYLWLTYRTFALRAPLRLTWRQVYRQFGAHPDNASDKRTVLNFRRKVLRELKKIKLAWPELNYSTAPGVLILHPSIPAIAPLNQGQLTSYATLSRRGDRP